MYENMYNIGVKENADMVLGVPEYTYLNPSENQTYFYLLINQINVFTILQPEQDNAPEKYLKRKIPGSGGLLLLTCLHRLSILWTILLSFQLLLLLCILVSTQIRF